MSCCLISSEHVYSFVYMLEVKEHHTLNYLYCYLFVHEYYIEIISTDMETKYSSRNIHGALFGMQSGET